MQLNKINKIKNYFSPDELKCPCCGIYNIDYSHLLNINKLRDIYGSPIIVNSSCRCSDHNKSVGGVKNSKHITSNNLKCKASDLTVSDINHLYHIAVDSKLFQKVIYYPDKHFIHVQSK